MPNRSYRYHFDGRDFVPVAPERFLRPTVEPYANESEYTFENVLRLAGYNPPDGLKGGARPWEPDLRPAVRPEDVPAEYGPAQPRVYICPEFWPNAAEHAFVVVVRVANYWMITCDDLPSLAELLTQLRDLMAFVPPDVPGGEP